MYTSLPNEADEVEENQPLETPPQRLLDERPWGKFEQFVLNQSVSVKIITVLPGEQLSLQSHTKRSEWWVVLDDQMDVEIDGERFTVKKGEDVFIPCGARHRAFGLDESCRWLEIAFGIFQEDDIVRYEDKYGRS